MSQTLIQFFLSVFAAFCIISMAVKELLWMLQWMLQCESIYIIQLDLADTLYFSIKFFMFLQRFSIISSGI